MATDCDSAEEQDYRDRAMTNDEIDERRAKALWDTRLVGILGSQEATHTIRASDEAAHLGYYDTRTHVAVPREPTPSMFRAGDNAAHPEETEVGNIYRAMIEAGKQ